MRKQQVLMGILALALLLALAVVVSLTYAQEPKPQSAANAQASPVGTAFTYQGQLKSGGEPVNGTCDFQFGLYDAASLGNQIGITQTESITVTDGLFTENLDFGDVFTGTARWLGIRVMCTDLGDTEYAELGRESLTAAPYAQYALGAPWDGLTGVPAGFADDIDNTDDAVSWDEISPIVGDGSNQVAAGDHTHPGDDITSPVATATLAFSATHASWFGLTGVPAGFADGVDDDTTYTAGEGLVLNGTEFSARGSPYANVIVVARSGGGFTSIQSALDSITGTADSRYLIWVAPGTYTETVIMEPYVDIEGAGELVTKISASISVTWPITVGTVVGADYAELRSLTVENIGGSDYAVAIYNSFASPRLTRVTVMASGGIYWNYGVYNAASSSPVMREVVITSGGGTVRNWGVYNDQYASPTMRDVFITVSGDGISNYGVENKWYAAPIMADMIITVSGESEWNLGVMHGASSVATDSLSMSDVTVSALGALNENHGVYNQCNCWGQVRCTMTMMNVSASAAGGTRSDAVHNSCFASTMVNVVATASGGTYSTGVYNGASPAAMTNVIATASDASDTNYGVYNLLARPTIQNSTISASGGTNSYGVYNDYGSGGGSYVVRIDNSQVTGSTSTIYTDGLNVRVGATLLSGGPVYVGPGSVTCAGVYDEGYSFYASTCP